MEHANNNSAAFAHIIGPEIITSFLSEHFDRLNSFEECKRARPGLEALWLPTMPFMSCNIKTAEYPRSTRKQVVENAEL